VLTTSERHRYVDNMRTQAREFAAIAEALLANVVELLDSSDPKTRVRGVHHLAAGVEALERQVLLEAQGSGLTWAQIGDIYGVSRQAAHRRFSDDTVVPSDFFDALLQDLDDTEIVPALTKAAGRVHRVTSA
jgi:DNA-directed RNA polymerase specialized sigma24 family protein